MSTEVAMGAGNSRHTPAAIKTYHLYDGSAMIMDVNAKGAVEATYSYGLGLNAIDSKALKGYYHSDALGSITEITGKEGNALRSYRYDAWGEMTGGEAVGDGNPFRYVCSYGVRWQDKTLGMYHMGARWMSPQTGRFMQKDPIGDTLACYSMVLHLTQKTVLFIQDRRHSFFFSFNVRSNSIAFIIPIPS